VIGRARARKRSTGRDRYGEGEGVIGGEINVDHQGEMIRAGS
jgi:hypothetical protein